MSRALILIVTGLMASPLVHASESPELRKLAGLLAGKALICRPESRHRGDERSGDEGYFSIRVRANYVEIFDNGSAVGYGFGNGSIKGMAMMGNELILDAGDDGKQTLLFDFGRLSGSSARKDNCGPGLLADASECDEYNGSSTLLQCCVK